MSRIIGNTVGTPLNPKKVAEIVDTANALKGSASGSAIRISDISPVEHTLKVGVRSKNLFDVSKELTGKWIKPGTGEIGTYAEFNTSDYIAIPPNTAFTINYVRQGAFYDENKGYISDMESGTVTTQRTYTMPANAHYLRFSYQNKKASGDMVQLELGTEVGAYTPFVDVSSVTLLVNGESYHPNPDGTVEGVKSVYPYMALSVEEIGVAIDVEYNRDINKAYGALLNAITALGGSVENFVEETPVLEPPAAGVTLTINTSCVVSGNCTILSLYINGEKKYTTPGSMPGHSGLTPLRSDVFENVTEAYIVLEGKMYEDNYANVYVNDVEAWMGDPVGSQYDLLALGTDTINIVTDATD